MTSKDLREYAEVKVQKHDLVLRRFQQCELEVF